MYVFTRGLSTSKSFTFVVCCNECQYSKLDSSRSKQDQVMDLEDGGTSSKTIRCPFFSPCGLPDGVLVTEIVFFGALHARMKHK